MNDTHNVEGRGDAELAANVEAAAAQLPRSTGQTSLLNEINDTTTVLNQSESSSSASNSAPLMAVPVDRTEYREEVASLIAQIKRFTVDNSLSMPISTNLAKKCIVHTLLSLHHPDAIAATVTIVAILEGTNQIPSSDGTALVDAMLNINETKLLFDQARSCYSTLSWSSLFIGD